MIFPIGDTQVRGGFKPIFAYSFIGLNIVLFIVQMLTPGNLVCELSVIPQNIMEGKDTFTLLTSMFLHGGYMHIIGNMLFLWVFADNIEATIGNLKFVVFYLLGGLAASLAHVVMSSGNADLVNCCQPCLGCDTSATICNGYIPSLGASGAISAVMGAYLVMFPKSQIKVLVLIFFRSFMMSAWVFLGLWFVQQLFAGVGTTINVQSSASEGVAWWAHIGGFAFGIVSGFYLKKFVGKNQKDDSINTEYV